jgi:hypothetical protein
MTGWQRAPLLWGSRPRLLLKIQPAPPARRTTPYTTQILFTGLLILACAALQSPAHWAALAFGALGLASALVYLIVAETPSRHLKR